MEDYKRKFSKSKLSLQKWLYVPVLWAKDTSVTDVIDDAEVDKRTGADMCQWLREVCTTKLMRIIVKVDESLFCHKPKASLSHL